MNLVRSSIVPQTIASDTAQKTNSKNHFAAPGTVDAAIAGVSMFEPGRKRGKKPVPPMNGKRCPEAAPKAKANPAIQ